MSATLVQLRDEIKFKRKEIQGDPDFPDAVLNRYVNESQRYVQTQLANLGIKQWESSDSLTLSSGSLADKTLQTADLSSDCPNRLFDDKNAIKFIICSNSGGSATDKGIARYIDDDRFLELVRNSYSAPTITQPAFTRISNTLYISPSTVDTAVAHYYKVLADLASDSTETGIPLAYEEFIVKRALIGIDEQLNRINNKDEKIAQLTQDLKNTFMSLNAGVQSEKTNAVLQ